MKDSAIQLLLHSNRFLLLPEKAIYWIEQNTLIISDLHLGKSEHFRRNGIGVPDYTREDLRRLDLIIERYKAERIIILGDLFHSVKNLSFIWFEEWLNHTHLTKIILIKGNHDIIPEFRFRKRQLAFTPSYHYKKFCFTHFKEQHEDPFIINFSGHLHPAINIKGKAKQVLKLECFVKGNSYIILPAFGSFTGNMIVERSSHEEIYAIAGNEVFKLP